MKTEDTLQDELDALMRYGRVMLWQRDDLTWALKLDLHTNTVAAKVELCAKTGHVKPIGAVRDVLAQAVTTVNSFEFVVK